MCENPSYRVWSVFRPSLRAAFITCLRAWVVSMSTFVAAGQASNPITDLQFTADPSAHVFNGRLYVYPSHDRNDAQEFDMTDYHVYSTDDLQNWQDHGVVLDLNDVPWAKKHLWAPDCAFKNGMYYFYFPANPKVGKEWVVGVATSTSPSGPFKDAGQPIAGIGGIDPAVFVDDDGQAYIYWAGPGALAAKLKPSMTELDGEPVKLQGVEHFYEGPWMFKRSGVYYLSYPGHIKGGSGDGGDGQWFDYATSNRPLGPFVYKGHFSRSGPGGGNIHGSQVEWQRKWYCFYHDFSTSVGDPKRCFKRAVRMDEMHFNPDGTIQELSWTADGPPCTKNLDPYLRCAATCLNGSDVPASPHAVTTEACSEGGMDLGQLDPGNWVRYANVDFGAKGATVFQARVASPSDGSEIELHLDRLDGPLAGVCSVPNTGGWQIWQKASCQVNGAKGKHFLYMKFISRTGNTIGLLNMQWFQFAP